MNTDKHVADFERLAREAGLVNAYGAREIAHTDALARFAALVRADALEQAAQVAAGAQQLPNAGDDFANGWTSCALQVAQAIRALSAP